MYNQSIITGMATYLTLVPAQVRIEYILSGCDLSAPAAGAGRRRLMQPNNGTLVNATVLGNVTAANSTVRLALDDVPSSVLVTKLQPLYNISTAGAALAALSASVNAALAAAGLPPLSPVHMVGSLTLAPVAPPPPRPPPLPPGETPASLLAIANAEKKSSRGTQLRDLQEAGTAVAYAIAGLVVLWLPVQAAVHAVQAAYLRRTAVTAALAIRIGGGGPDQRAARMSSLGASAGDADADAEEEESKMAGKRFGAPKLASALIEMLATEAAAAAAADLQKPPRQPMLRPLLRTPLLTALGAKATTDASQRLSARKKPTNPLWRFKRWLTSELHWQAREMRHALRAFRRCCGGSRDPVGKAFRAVPTATAGFGAAGAVLVEVTWRFGWSGRNGAACWRRRLRDDTQLAALETAIAEGLACTAAEVTVQPAGSDACERPITVALLDDEPHANLDKKRKEKRNTSVVADATAAEVGADGRSAGVAPAVAARLEAVLELCALRNAKARRSSVGAPGGDMAQP